MRAKLAWSIVVIAFLIWEGWWWYVFETTPRPDEKMHTVLAIACGIFLPIVLALFVGTFFALRAFHRPRG